MMSYEEAIEYIKFVLNKWTIWKTHHKTLTEALEVILKHNDDGGSSQ